MKINKKIKKLKFSNDSLSEYLKKNLDYYKFKSRCKNKHELEMDEYLLCIIMPIKDFQITIKLTDIKDNYLEYEMFGKIQSGEFKNNAIYLARIYIKDKTIRYCEKILEACLNWNLFSRFDLSNNISNIDDINKYCDQIIFYYLNYCEPNLSEIKCIELKR